MSSNQLLSLSRYGRALTRTAGAFAAVLSLATAHADSADHFPVRLSPEIPHDINPELRQSLINAKEYARLERDFNILSWQSFIAINWPVDSKGVPLAKFGDRGTPRWMDWKESFEVFRCDGGKPSPWGSDRSTLPTCDQGKALNAISNALPNPGKHTRLLYLSDKSRNLSRNVLDETGQAFTGPLADQNGNVVRYEILLNKDEFDYIVDENNQLYNLDGQIRFSQTHAKANFPSGDFHGKTVGALEIKLAWKVLDESKGDLPSRFFTSDAYIYENGTWRKTLMGLVGMHISQKTQTSPQWVWSTFEQVDNIQVNALEEVTVNGKKVHVKPSFNNPDCETCVINQLAYKDDAHKKAGVPLPAQMHRMIPIPLATAQLNQEVQALLRAESSVFQYYELVGTQYPLDATAAPSTPGNVPQAINNKPGGNPNRAYLTNMTMETYFQLGNQNASNLQEGNPPSKQQVFGTESCMGCHSSAGIATGYTQDPSGSKTAIFNAQLTGDFSWLLSQKAQWAKPRASPPRVAGPTVP